MQQNKAAVAILLEQLKEVHKYLGLTMEGVTDEVAAYQPAGTANPIAGTYAHLVMSEDFFVQMLLQNKQPLMEGEYKDKTGASAVQPNEWVNEYPKWLREVKVDVKKLHEYANAVYSASEKYLESLTDEDLYKEVDLSAFGMGMRSVHAVIAGMVIGHAYSIMGEVSVIKGLQGLKGYPF